MSKLIITKNQFSIIIEHINNEKKIINEGWRDIVLGTAMLLGLPLTGQNKIVAQDALKNEKIMGNIKTTLESDKLDDIAISLEEIGLKDALFKLKNNTKEIEIKYNKIASDNNIKNKLYISHITNED